MLAQAEGDEARAVHSREQAYAEAHGLYQKSLVIKEGLADKAGIASSLGQLALLAIRRGHLTEAETLYWQVIESFRELNLGVSEGIASFNLALLYEVQMRWEESLQLLEQSVKLLDTAGSAHKSLVFQVLKRVRSMYNLSVKD